MDVRRLPDVLRVAETLGLKPLVDPEPFVTETMVLPCEDRASGMQVDFIFSFSDYEHQAIDRAVDVEVRGAKVRFISVEDLIVFKMIAGRPRDLEDVRQVALKNPHLDADYVRRWLQDFEAVVERPLVREVGAH